MNATKGDYTEVNGLRMYYETRGTGRPLIVLHGAYMTVDAMSALVPDLAEIRRVISVELQGHGRTADVADRPITYEGMADDVAALLRHLGIDEADTFGYSMGGGVALQLAIRHPGSVRRLVVASASYTSDGMQPELHEHHARDVRRVHRGGSLQRGRAKPRGFSRARREAQGA